MREPLEHGKPQHYERPNQSWVCGLAREGRGCPAGPTAGGACPALAECAPVRDGDRWRCNRSTLRGGPCDEGPTPDGHCARVNRCRPVRSLRAMRRRFVVACTLVTAGALLMLVSANWRDEFISPGPLALQHAQLLERTGAAQRCSTCHAAADQGVWGWTGSLVVGHGDAPTQSALCMQCHERTFAAEWAVAAHNLRPEQLATILPDRSTPPDAVACAACHQEHHGADANLTAIDNGRCQACHQERYRSFADGHPDFGVWPYERRTRIIFDHASHQSKHFVDEKQAFDCRRCHLDDATQTVQLLANYESACAACHDEKIKTSVARGVPMFAVPMLDVDALRDAGIDVGPWPEAATGEFDGQLPAAMKLLLSADPAAAQAMATLGEDFEFFDVDPEDAEHVQAAGTLAAAIKTLLAELSQSGPAAVRARLERTLGRDVPDTRVNALVAGLSVDTLRPAVAAWLPKKGISPILTPDPASSKTSDSKLDLSPFSFALAGVWSRDDATFTIRYRLTGHADPVMAEWLSLVVAADGRESPLAAALAKELTKPTAPGLCASCHSVEQMAAGRLAINWRGGGRDSFATGDNGGESKRPVAGRSRPLGRRAPRTFTKFAHGPHLLLPQLADCTHCHAVDAAANTSASYADVNPHSFVSDFLPLSKRQCVECHTPSAAGDRCQSCHNYHVEMVEPWR